MCCNVDSATPPCSFMPFLIFHYYYYRSSFEMIKVLLSASQRISKKKTKHAQTDKTERTIPFGSSHTNLEQFKGKTFECWAKIKHLRMEKICTLYHNIKMNEKQPKVIKPTKLYISRSSQRFPEWNFARVSHASQQTHDKFTKVHIEFSHYYLP